MNYFDEKKFIGHPDQLMKVKKICFQDGKADSVKMIDVQNRSGLHFDVNISRGMDLPYVDYNGENLGFISPCGIVAPDYFDDNGLGFLKSFTAGFMTTCGLKVAGAPCEYDGKKYGLHGNVSHTPAEDVSYKIIEDNDNPYIEIEGTVRDAVIFGDKLVLRRKIKTYYKDKRIFIHDTVKNEGYRRTNHMILYHCNIGYPLLTPESELFIPSLNIRPRDEHANDLKDSWNCLQKPDSDFQEVCYYHTLKMDENGFSSVAVFNDVLNMGVAITFDTNTLDHFVQWKMMSACDYVLGLEPCNSTIDGIENAIDNGSMKFLKPQESVEYNIIFDILENRNAFQRVKQKYL